jgi:hypothetical protein
MLEPIMLRSNSQRDSFAWKRWETTASAGELMAFTLFYSTITGN